MGIMSVLVALIVGGLTFGVAQVLLTSHRRAVWRKRLGPYVAEAALRRSRQAHGPLANRVTERAESLLRRLGLHGRLSLAIERTGLEVQPGAFASLVAGAVAVTFLLLLLVSGIGAAFLGAAFAVVVAWLAVVILAHRRSRAFDLQLPEILDTLSSALRAGHGFDHALQTVAADIGDPAGAEFRRVVAEVHLGRSLESALADLGKRVRSEDFEFVLDAVMVQRQVGGSLAQLFELVADTVRSREQFRRKLKATTGMVRTSANVLTCLPVAAAVLLTAVNPGYTGPLWRTNAGHVLVAVALGMMVCGGLALRKIGSVKG